MDIQSLFAVPAESNLAWGWIQVLFGATGPTPFTSAIHIFSTTLLLLASGMLGWHVVSGMVQSAHTGKILGDRWHQIWAPLRVVVGIGLLAPALPSGLSGAHFLVEQVSIVSLHLADRVWGTFVRQVATEGHALFPASAGGRTLVWQVLESEICHLVHRQAPVARLYGRETALPPPEGVLRGGIVRWTWGTECGAFTLTMPESRAGFAEARRSAVAEFIRDLRDKTRIAAAYADHFASPGSASGIVNEAQAEALRNAGILPASIAEFVRTAGDLYDRRIMQAASAEASARDSEARARLADGAEGQGWMAAGMYWRALSQVSAMTTSLATELPQRTDLRPDAWGPDGAAVRNAMGILGAQMRGESSGAPTANDLAFAGDASSDAITRTLAPLTRPIAEWMTNSQAAEDPMGRMISFGHALLAGGEAAIAAGAVVAAAGGNVVSSALGGEGAVTWILDWSKILIGVVMLVGVVHAYVLPVIPFVFVAFLALGWVVSVLEALIAAVVWAACWVRMDGQDLIDSVQRPGLMLIFNLLLRPVTGILALCGAYYLVPLGLNYVNSLWGTAYLGQQGGHVVGVVGIIAGMVLLTFIQWRLIIWTFGLVVELPDRIARWFGAPTTGWGESSAGQSIVAGAVSITHASGRVAAPLAAAAGSTAPPDKGEGAPSITGHGSTSGIRSIRERD